MKNNLRKFWDNLFLIFLIFYTGITISHVFEFEKVWWIYLLFIGGLILARFAHIKKNYITIILLLLHMSIEWFEWSQNGMSLSQGILNGLHVIMDFIFLTHELSVHAKKNRYIILSICIALLLIIFLLGHFIISPQLVFIENAEPFVIGGILGCVLSHLYYHLRSNFSLKEEHKHWH